MDKLTVKNGRSLLTFIIKQIIRRIYFLINPAHTSNIREWSEENTKKLSGRIKFTKIVVNDMNVAIQNSKKDQCDICMHLAQSETRKRWRVRRSCPMKRWRKKKIFMGRTRRRKNTCLYHKHLESVVLCPKTAASAIYYKEKFQLHNFSIYKLWTQNVELYVWHEFNSSVKIGMNFFSVLPIILENVSRKEISRNWLLWAMI